MPAQRYLNILKTLLAHHVDFIVVGGVAAVLQGAPVNTLDIDVVHSTTPENVERLLTALRELDAFYRMQPERKFRPDASHLTTPGHQLLTTRFGPIDFLGSVSKQRTYADLISNSEELLIAPQLAVNVLNLAMLITLKEELGREKDLAVLPILRRTLEEARRQP